MAKSAQDRLGFFSEPGYVSVGDKFKDPNPDKPFNTAAYKKSQMMTTISKSRVVGSNDGFLDKTYKRIFAGEATYDPVRARRKEQAKEKKKNVSTNIFGPTSHGKKLVGSGSHLGTFGGTIPAMDNRRKPKPKYKPEQRNFTTAPSKKGTGFGYVDVTIGKFPEYKSTPFGAELKKERAQNKASKSKMVTSSPFKLNAPEGGDTFQKDPYKLTKSMPARKSKPSPAPKKVTVPFYPSKPPPTMAGGNKNFGTLNKFTYVAEKPVKKEKKKPPIRGEWKAISNPRTRVTKSIVSMQVSRGMTRSSISSTI